MSDAAKSVSPLMKSSRPDVEPLAVKLTRMPSCWTLAIHWSSAFADHDDPSPEIGT